MALCEGNPPATITGGFSSLSYVVSGVCVMTSHRNPLIFPQPLRYHWQRILRKMNKWLIKDVIGPKIGLGAVIFHPPERHLWLLIYARHGVYSALQGRPITQEIPREWGSQKREEIFAVTISGILRIPSMPTQRGPQGMSPSVCETTSVHQLLLMLVT